MRQVLTLPLIKPKGYASSPKVPTILLTFGFLRTPLLALKGRRFAEGGHRWLEVLRDS